MLTLVERHQRPECQKPDEGLLSVVNVYGIENSTSRLIARK